MQQQRRGARALNRVANVATGLLLILTAILGGALLGAVYVRFFVPRTGMGWDQLADALGGFMLGALFGLVVGIVATIRLKARGRLIAAGAAVCVVAVSAGVLRLAAGPSSESAPVVREEDFRPWFRIAVRVGHTEDVLNGVARGQEPLPFTEASVWTTVPEFIHVGWGPEFRRCMAEPGVDDLQFLLPLAMAAADEAAAGECRTPRGNDLGIVMNFSRENERGGGDRVESDCLVDRPALADLADAMQTVAAKHCPLD